MKNIYITWHYTTHGVAYLKHILSQFYLIRELPIEINFSQLEQEELNSTFNSPKSTGFLFDEIIYLTAPQKAFDGVSSRRFSHRTTVLDDPEIKKSKLGIVYHELIEIYPEHKLSEEISFIENNYPDLLSEYKELVWRNIQHYPVEEQIKWLTEYSNFKNVYSNKFKVVELKIDDFRNEKQISDVISRWIRHYFFRQKNCRPIINVSLGSNETQVVWHILAEAGQLPDTTRFIKTYDDKNDKPEKRFKQFSIQEIATNLISTIGAEFKIYDDTKSPSRALANKKMETYLKLGFSILLIGERGIGKSKIASEAKQKFDPQSPFVEANCASFDEDSKAESELFGYEKGAFTGANAVKIGLLEAANGGILFLDEIHHLSKLVQAKLMKALQTDKKNKMAIRRIGSNKEIKVECRLIFATNKSIVELRNELLPDFYDRIVQYVVNIPPIRNNIKDRPSDWEKVWSDLNLKGMDGKWLREPPDDEKLNEWLLTLPLYGNYRDLQKIAISYHAFNHFDMETKGMLIEANAFQYAKNEFEKYHSLVVQPENEKFNFNNSQTTKEMLADYLFELQNWAVLNYKSRKAAIEHFRLLGDTVAPETFNNWKNRDSVKKKK
jgi:transcriptional regulator with AAA-type ATPase domain